MAGISLEQVLRQTSESQGSAARVRFEDPAARFVVREEPRYKSVWSSLATAFSRGAKGSNKNAIYLFTEGIDSNFGLSSKFFLGTFLLHVAIAFMLFRFVHFAAAADNRFEDVSYSDAKLYYVVPTAEQPKPLRRIAPPGPGSAPGRGEIAEEIPVKASTALHKILTVVSNPPHPDNSHQTIIQPASPPNLIIERDLKLPNIVLGDVIAQPKSPIALRWKNPAPNPATPKTPDASAVPVVNTPRTDPIVTGTLVPDPALPVAPPQPAAAAAPAATQNASAEASDAANGAKIQGAAGGKDLIVLGTDPDNSVTNLALPPGNRYGTFSLSPDGAGSGSAGGSAKGVPGAGTGGNGPGGNSSTGVGPGSTGGGGGSKSSDAGSLSVTGAEGNGARDRALKAAIAETMVFPVVTPPNLRKNAMVISSGYVGGGGLGVYKALPCSKIYTVFFSMPGGNWALEYCPVHAAQPTETPVDTPGRTPVVHLAPGVIPPAAIELFDFQRLPVDQDTSRKLIILRGIIHEDGKVSDVKIYQGLQPEMDEAARIAFSKWTFKPALQAGKNIAVEFLVGIPPVSAAGQGQ